MIYYTDYHGFKLHVFSAINMIYSAHQYYKISWCHANIDTIHKSSAVTIDLLQYRDRKPDVLTPIHHFKMSYAVHAAMLPLMIIVSNKEIG